MSMHNWVSNVHVLSIPMGADFDVTVQTGITGY